MFISIYIQLSNPYEEDVKIKNGEFITAKTDKKNHGFGIKSVKELVNENNGKINISFSDNIFNVEVIFYEVG